GLGWRPHAEQVGQTGSRISPDVYIACGISGAIQHMAGIEGAKTLVAINTDEEATMVQRADYAIIGDLHEVVGAVNEEIVRRRGGAQLGPGSAKATSESNKALRISVGAGHLINYGTIVQTSFPISSRRQSWPLSNSHPKCAGRIRTCSATSTTHG